MKHTGHLMLCMGMVVASIALHATAQTPVPITNPSFEFPTVDTDSFPVAIDVDDWEDEGLGMGVDGATPLDTGSFANPPDTMPLVHLTNADGNRVAFMGTKVGNEFWQDLGDVFTPGLQYQLTAGVAVSLQAPPPANAIMEIGLYYRDNVDARIDVVAQEIATTGLTATFLVDFTALTGVVQPTDAWANRDIGVFLRAAGSTTGGFWDLDNVRLVSQVPEPAAGAVVLLGLIAATMRRRTS